MTTHGRRGPGVGSTDHDPSPRTACGLVDTISPPHRSRSPRYLSRHSDLFWPDREQSPYFRGTLQSYREHPLSYVIQRFSYADDHSQWHRARSPRPLAVAGSPTPPRGPLSAAGASLPAQASRRSRTPAWIANDGSWDRCGPRPTVPIPVSHHPDQPARGHHSYGRQHWEYATPNTDWYSSSPQSWTAAWEYAYSSGRTASEDRFLPRRYSSASDSSAAEDPP